MENESILESSFLSENPLNQGTLDKNLYVALPANEFDFPVVASKVDLSTMYMNLIRWQWHEEVEFFIVQSGQALLKLPDKSFLLSEGEGVFLNQNQLHSIHAPGNNPCTLRALKFHPSFLFGYGKTQMSSKYLTPILSAPNLHYFILKKEDPHAEKLLRLVNQSIKLYLSKQFGYELEICGLLCRLWIQLFTVLKSLSDADISSPILPSVDSTRIKQAMRFVEENHMEPLTLEEIASSIHVSKSECCRCFQRALGLTPFEYLMKYRIYASTRKIMQGDEVAKSISTLAASVGFNNTSYYNKLFKKYLGCTPTQYKKYLLSSVHSKNPDTYA